MNLDWVLQTISVQTFEPIISSEATLLLQMFLRPYIRPPVAYV